MQCSLPGRYKVARVEAEHYLLPHKDKDKKIFSHHNESHCIECDRNSQRKYWPTQKGRIT